jgi:hemerythrin-like domain-containing protein
VDTKIFNLLQKLITSDDDSKYYEFANKYCDNYKRHIEKEGWLIYNMKNEFERQELDFSDDVFINFK